MRLDWDNFTDDKIKDTIEGYIENWDDFFHHGWGFEFGGNQGLGKTFCATYVGKELIKRNKSVYYVLFKDAAFAWKKEEGDALDEIFRKVDLLILDDVEVGKSFNQSAVFADHFEALVRHRSNNSLPTIITTNASEEELEDAYPRVYSLLAANQSRIEFSGKDYRRTTEGLDRLDRILNGEKDPIT